jgi:hypothetical protein
MIVVATVLVASGCLAIFVTGCGDDDPTGQSGPPVSPFSGTYHYVQMTGTIGLSPYRSETGRFAPVRSDSIRFADVYTAYDGASDGPITPPDRALTFQDDRQVVFTDPVGLTMQGKFSPGGKAIVLHSDTLDTYVGFMLAAKMNPAPTQDDLTGYWALMQFGLIQEPAPSTNKLGLAAYGRVEININGNFMIHNGTYNLGGAIDPVPVIHPAADLIVGNDGWVDLKNNTANRIDFRGAVSADGNLILLGAEEGFDGQAGIRVLVREGLATGVPDAVGTYFEGGFGWIRTTPNPPAMPGAFHMSGELALNGSGVGTWVIPIPPHGFRTVPVAYDVASYGFFEMDMLSVNMFKGGIGTDGDFMVMVGPFELPDSDPWFHAAVR